MDVPDKCILQFLRFKTKLHSVARIAGEVPLSSGREWRYEGPVSPVVKIRGVKIERSHVARNCDARSPASCATYRADTSAGVTSVACFYTIKIQRIRHM